MKKLLLVLFFFVASCENKENFTVRKNLNKVLNDFYKDGEFYSCSYDNKSYIEQNYLNQRGFVYNFREVLKKEKFHGYQIFDEIILIYTKKRIGLMLSEGIPSLYNKRYIFNHIGDNQYNGLNYWGTSTGFYGYGKLKNVEEYIDEKGDLKWDKLGLNYNDYDYDFKKEKNELSTFNIVFKDNTLRTTIIKTYVNDYYKCQEINLLTKKEKKEMLESFLDQKDKYISYEDMIKQHTEKYMKIN